MPFGDFLGKKEIVNLFLDHKNAKKLYSIRQRSSIKNYGYLLIKLFGYPLSVTSREKANIILKNFMIKRNEKVLDVGCGIGVYSFALNIKYGCNMTGIDIDAGDISMGNKIAKILKSNVSFIAGNSSNLGLNNQTVDKIIMLDVLESLENETKVLDELYRVLKLQGQLLISAVIRENIEDYYRPPKDGGKRLREGYTFEKLVEVLNNSGFKIEEYQYYNKKFTFEVSGFKFLIGYPLSMLDNLYRGKGRGIVVIAKKLE